MDDTATNDIELFCSDKLVYSYTTYKTEYYGTWDNTKYCKFGHRICGVQYQVLPSGAGDDTGINDVQIMCCPFI